MSFHRIILKFFLLLSNVWHTYWNDPFFCICFNMLFHKFHSQVHYLTGYKKLWRNRQIANIFWSTDNIIGIRYLLLLFFFNVSNISYRNLFLPNFLFVYPCKYSNNAKYLLLIFKSEGNFQFIFFFFCIYSLTAFTKEKNKVLIFNDWILI